QTAGAGTGPPEARGAPAPDPAADARAGAVCPALRARVAQWRWPACGRSGFWIDSPFLLHRPLCGDQVARAIESPATRPVASITLPGRLQHSLPHGMEATI